MFKSLRLLPFAKTNRFLCNTEKSKKLKIYLEISVRESVANGMNTKDLVDLFKGISKQSEDKKVLVTTSLFP